MGGIENRLLGLLAYEGSQANRGLRAAGVDLDGACRVISLFYDSIPVSEGITRFIATAGAAGRPAASGYCV
jgi:hypothetical protein